MSSQDPPQPFRPATSEMAPTGESEEDEIRAAKIANRFDIRRIIGGVFLLYGVILIVTGIVGTHAVKNKAAGINIDLWTGIAMLIVAAMMIAWALWRPVAPEPEETRGQGSGRIRRAPAT
jgi:NADH:ubiquinone oxidoreductase subunit 6 (subunit J)